MGDGKTIGKLYQFPVSPKEQHKHVLEEGWASGEALCTSCSHTWVAVAPVGISEMECPECHALRGIFANHLVHEGDAVDTWTCNCGSPFFVIQRFENRFQHILCVNCGLPQEF